MGDEDVLERLVPKDFFQIGENRLRLLNRSGGKQDSRIRIQQILMDCKIDGWNIYGKLIQIFLDFFHENASFLI
ncbi:MAG: hypothetical protein SOI16_03220 [Eubacteriales bacterium]